MSGPPRTVAVAGLGAIGGAVARALDPASGGGIEGLRLVAVSARDHGRAAALVRDFADPPAVVDPAALSVADIVDEAGPAAAFDAVARPAVAAGRMLVVCSAGALLRHPGLIAEARRTGARILLPTGAIAGLDAVRAAAEGPVASVAIETRKPPQGLAGVPYLIERGIVLDGLAAPLLVFEGDALEAAAAFPANANVAAALALAGVGPERTKVRIWADPTVERNIHTVRVDADAARLTLTVENLPSESNPRTSRLSALSVLACLRGLVSPLKAGS